MQNDQNRRDREFVLSGQYRLSSEGAESQRSPFLWFSIYTLKLTTTFGIFEHIYSIFGFLYLCVHPST